MYFPTAGNINIMIWKKIFIFQKVETKKAASQYKNTDMSKNKHNKHIIIKIN